MYPNPADAHISITTTAIGIVTAELVDTYGRTAYSQCHSAAGTVNIDIRDIPAGVYILLLHHSTGTERHKLIIQH